MSWHNFILFTAVVFAVTYCPGPMTMFCMSTALRVGHKGALPVLIGGSNACAVVLLLVSLGIGLLIQHSKETIEVIKWIGVGYVFYLGIKQWRSHIILKKLSTQTHKKEAPWKLYLHGFTIGVTNPKLFIALTVILPHFVNFTDTHWPQLFFLCAVYLLIQFSSLAFYTYFGAVIFKYLQRKHREDLPAKITGTVLIIIALLLAVSKVT